MRSTVFLRTLPTPGTVHVYIHIHRVYSTLRTVCIDGVERLEVNSLEKTASKSPIHTIGGYTHEKV